MESNDKQIRFKDIWTDERTGKGRESFTFLWNILTGTNLTDVNLTGVILDGVILCKTTVPDETINNLGC